MTAEGTSVHGPPQWLVRAVRPGNVLPAFVWLFLVASQVSNSSMPPSPSTAGLILINTVFLVLFMIRRDAAKVGGKPDLAIALIGTCLVALLHDEKSLTSSEVYPTAIQLAGILGWAWALVSLGKSFGIVAADRGLVQSGPYRFIRHPIYAFEILFFLGYLAAVPTLHSGVIISVWIVFQCLRIIREELILEGYSAYSINVRWRLIPFIW